MYIALAFPVILINKNNNNFFVHFDDNSLRSADGVLLEKQAYTDYKIIDALGRVIEIEKVIEEKKRNFFRLYPFVKVKENFKFSYLSRGGITISLNVFKADLISRLEYVLIDNTNESDQLLESIRISKSFTEIGSLLRRTDAN